MQKGIALYSVPLSFITELTTLQLAACHYLGRLCIWRTIFAFCLCIWRMVSLFSSVYLAYGFFALRLNAVLQLAVYLAYGSVLQ